MTDQPQAVPPRRAFGKINVDAGLVELSFPMDLSAEDVLDLEQWFLLMVRGMRRRAGLPYQHIKPFEAARGGEGG